MNLRPALAALALAAAAPLVIAPPAHADWFGASIRHVDPDPGYHRALYVAFENGDVADIGVGEHSDHFQPDGQENVTHIYVYAGEEIWCDAPGRTGFVKKWDATGWHSKGLSNRTNLLCEARRDSASTQRDTGWDEP